MGLPKIGVLIEASGEEGYAKALKSVAAATDAASGSIDKASKSAGHLGSIFDIALGDLISGGVTKALSLVTNALGGIMDAVGNIASGIFKSTVGFSQTMANISAVTGATGKDLKVLNDQILAVGADSAAGPQAVADAYYDIASGVLDASTRLDVLKAAVQASEAGQADLGATTEFLISEMNAYGTASGGAAKVSDILTATVNKGVGKMDEFVHALTPLAGLAASSKISLTDLGGAMSYMTAKGVPAEQAATQLKAAMVLLSRNTPQVTRALKAMGEKSIEASIAAHGLGGTLDLVQKGALKTGQNLATMAGSVEALQAITVLGGEDFAKYFDTFVDGVDGATAAARELQRADVSYQLKLIGSRFQAIGIMVGEAVLPAFNKFLTFLNTQLASFDWKKIGEGLDKLGEKLGTAAGKIIDNVGAFLNDVDWNKVGDDISNALSGIGDFVANIDWASVVQGAKDVVSAIGDFVANTDWTSVVQGAKDVVEGVGNIVTKIGEVANAIAGLPAAFNKAARDIELALSPVVDTIITIGKFLQNPTGAGNSGDNKKPTDTGMQGQTTSNSVANQKQHAVDVQQSLTMPGVNVPSDVLAEANLAVQSAGNPVEIPTTLKPPTAASLTDALAQLNNTVVATPVQVPLKPLTNDDFTKAVVDPSKAGIADLSVQMQQGGADAIGAFAASIVTASPKAKDALGKSVTDSLNAGRSAGAGAGALGAGITAGIAAAIRAGGGDVAGALSGVIAAAIAQAKGQLGINSPSKVFMAIGDQVMAGWAKGITDNIKSPAMAISAAGSLVAAAAPPPSSGVGGNSYSETRNNTTVYNLGLQPYNAPDNGTNLLQAMRG